ncbi:hypothetical protein IWQ62_001015 [Dispira parvispora]|uniref:Dynein light intermediate chain n=1 Tax=Dispira parvispora TaxID=1520584 RepID=A0A9W8B019_9FUNG|nr:hypothetical protein IWQ62_001015 [Dispira parvispora]
MAMVVDSPLPSAPAQEQPPTNNTDAEVTNLWSDILNSVGSSKTTLSRNVLVLGDPQSGKSTLIRHMQHIASTVFTPTTPAAGSNFSHSVSTGTDDTLGNGATPDVPESKTDDLALAYTYIDVKDDDQDDVARLGLYQMADVDSTFETLLRHCINTDSMADTCVMIVLDWTKPWRFVSQLQKWFGVIERVVERIKDGTVDSVGAGQPNTTKAGGWTRGQVVVEECQEHLQRVWQAYEEPTEGGSQGTGPSSAAPGTSTMMMSSTAQSVLLPLGPGTLTHNLGLPIVIVACKTDALAKLEREQDYKEDHFDFVQQTLRTICLKYGASLFYTSLQRPDTFQYVYRYLVQRALNNPQPNSTANREEESATASGPERSLPHLSARSQKLFAFPYRAHVVERDFLVVPAGWDSWSKIQILRDGYDCDALSRGWDDDVNQRKGNDSFVSTAEGGDSEDSARKIYAEVITDPFANQQGLVVTSTVETEDNQEFLERHYRAIQQSSTEDATRPVHATHTLSTVGDDGGQFASALASKATVDTASRRGIPENGASSTDDVSSKLSSLLKPREGSRSGTNGGSGALANLIGGVRTTATSSSSGSNAQSEVMASFFKSLLNKKPTGQSDASGAGSSGESPALGLSASEPNTSQSSSGATASSQDVAAELARLRSQLRNNQ